jgi:hypothetical protein
VSFGASCLLRARGVAPETYAINNSPLGDLAGCWRNAYRKDPNEPAAAQSAEGWVPCFPNWPGLPVVFALSGLGWQAEAPN